MQSLLEPSDMVPPPRKSMPMDMWHAMWLPYVTCDAAVPARVVEPVKRRG